MGEWIQFELTSADLPGALVAMNQTGCDIRDVITIGEMTVRFLSEKGSARRLRDVLERRGDRLRQLRRLGLKQNIRPWIRHPVLILGITLLLVLTVWLPTRVFFVQIEGNRLSPTNLILEKAEACGITFGSLRREVRSEQMKNALLEALPQLQWAGINTAGCVATITVREAQPVPEKDGKTATSIVASRDGVIRSCTVSRGTALCVPGQAVRAGEMLISGLTDCALVILADRAEGEVFAETTRKVMARTPGSACFRQGKTRTEQKFSLIIGKNRINFDNDSGILDSSCDKMYVEYYLTLPGGFRLPLGLGIETVIFCDTVEDAVSGSGEVMERYARSYLLSHMVAGKILEQQIAIEGNRLYADYICLEMIGQNRYEEFTREDGENDGKNG